MSREHPIIAITGSSGAFTPEVVTAFEHIFLRQNINAAFIQGSSFHRYDRASMGRELEKRADTDEPPFSHFGEEANLFDKQDELFRSFGDTGGGSVRHYIHSPEDARHHNAKNATRLKPGEFSEWKELSSDTDLLLYRGLHGMVKTDRFDMQNHVDLGIGVVPIVNLEWIQKIHADKDQRGYSEDAIVESILRRMRDYITYITPQFSRTDINFQRIPTVDTSNPFVALDVPTLDESFVVIRFRDPRKFNINFPTLQSRLKNSFMSRRNNIVVPGGQLQYAMELILEPIIHEMMAQRLV